MLGTPWWTSTLTHLNGLAEHVRAWPVTSQQQARRNAMVATTACAQRRAEREDVAEFLAERDEHQATPAATSHDPETAADVVRRTQHG